MRVWPNYSLEHELQGRGVTTVAGVDEVGVGALAGPVVAAAVILAPAATIDGLADPSCSRQSVARCFSPGSGNSPLRLRQGERRWRKWIDSMSIGRRWRHVAALSRRYRSFRNMCW